MLRARLQPDSCVPAVVLSLVLCASCAHLPARAAAPNRPRESVGRPGCGPPLSYQVFRRDAFGADWSKATGLIAYNAKGSRRRVPHLYRQARWHRTRAVRGGFGELPATHHRDAGLEPVGPVHRFCRREIGSPGQLGGRYPRLGQLLRPVGGQRRRFTRLAAHRRPGRQRPRHDHPGVLTRTAGCSNGPSAPRPARR